MIVSLLGIDIIVPNSAAHRAETITRDLDVALGDRRSIIAFHSGNLHALALSLETNNGVVFVFAQTGDVQLVPLVEAEDGGAVAGGAVLEVVESCVVGVADGPLGDSGVGSHDSVHEEEGGGGGGEFPGDGGGEGCCDAVDAGDGGGDGTGPEGTGGDGGLRAGGHSRDTAHRADDCSCSGGGCALGGGRCGGGGWDDAVASSGGLRGVVGSQAGGLD